MFLKLKFHAIVVFVFFVLLLSTSHAKKFNDNDFQFFSWENPTPRFSDLGLNIEDVCNIIGDSQLLISHNGRDVKVWSNDKKKIMEYSDVKFVSSLALFDLPREKVIEYYFDFEKYPAIIPQYTEGGIVKKEKNQFLVKLIQRYHFILVTLKADFRYQYMLEANGDYSALMLDGDVGAGVKRLEFIPINKNKTLVVHTSWVDMESARFVYRTILKAQPDIKLTAPLGAVAMETEQIRRYIKEQNTKKKESGQSLCPVPKTPVFANKNIPTKTLRHLSDMGTLVFVHNNQKIKTEKGVENVKFVSSIRQLPGTINQSKPVSSDFTRFGEYFKQAKKVKYRKGENGTLIDWYFKFGLGFIGVGMNYTINFNWQNENTVLFERFAGDFDPLYGAWEWIDLGTGNTLLVFTAAMQISDDASWALKLANKIPNVDVMGGIWMGILIVEKQAAWMKQQVDAAVSIAKHPL